MKDSVFGYFVRQVSHKINDLSSEKNLLALGPHDISDREDIFYHPEMHNEIRMAYSHLVRYEVLSGNLRIEQVVEDDELKTSLEEAISKGIDDCPNDGERKTQSANKDAFSEKKNEAYGDELNKALSHLMRTNMDADKLMYLDILRQKEDFIRHKKMDILDELDGAAFYSQASEKELQARALFRKAKIFETLGFHDEASENYKAASAKMRDLVKYLNSKEPAIKKARFNFRWAITAAVISLVVDLVVLAI